MKRAIFATILAFTALGASAAGIEGRWQNFDDEDGGKPKAVVAIHGATGKIVALSKGVDPNCSTCKKPIPLIGTEVLTNLQADGNNKYKGKIFDPKNSKTYSANVTVNGNSLKVCGYIGLSFIGRCQTWKRL